MVVAALFVGCTPDVTDETPQMTEIGDIEVTFSVDGSEKSHLDLASVSHNIKVDVALNNEGVYWNAVSNKEWCYIDNEITHRGSGSFNIVINANDSFDARETATIKFVAGEYVQKMSFAFDCKCFFGTILSVLRHDGVVEGGTGQLEKEKNNK